MNPELLISTRTRLTPFSSRVEACGVKAYTVYNHMLLPAIFRSLEEDYWHLCEAVQVWDVSCQRQVEITGPDSQKLVQLMTPRDMSQAKYGQCFYAPLCDESGGMINDPIIIKHSDEYWWISIADTDVMLWAKGLATGFELDVKVTEPDIWPLAIQGPKAEDLLVRIFSDEIKKIRFFYSKKMHYAGKELLIARSGWSKQGGFEIYVNAPELGAKLWDELCSKGEKLGVRAGCPNLIERIESGLLSFGGDMDYNTSPFECGLDQYVSLEADIKSLSIPALRKRPVKTRLMGIVIDQQVKMKDLRLYSGDREIGLITTNTWSPKYRRHLAFAKCDVNYISKKQNYYVISNNCKVPATITELPFNFESLGLYSYNSK